MTCQFKIDIFEGPLDLLLYLIRERKMDIHDIPIADITRQYLEYMDLMREMNLELAGEYLVMAAELARVKSRVLLPAAPAEATGEEGEDPRAELTRRLMEYQRFKNASAELRRKEEARQKVFPPRAEPLDEMKGDETLTDATVFDLFRAFREILDEKRERQDFEVQITNLSVTDRIQYLLDIVNTAESVAFNHLFNSANTRQEIIVTFLALLEIMRLKLVRVQQTGHFETIRVYPAADVQAQKEALAAYQESPAE